MRMSVTVGKKKYKVDLKNPLDISIPVSFGKRQLSAFGGAPAEKKTYRAEAFTGDVRKGGSCNCETYSFSPHLNGTHTECVGHITKKRVLVHEVAKESLIPATLLTVAPQRDLLITRGMLEKILKGNPGFLGALIVRTLPNKKSKTTRHYSSAPYFTAEAMRHIVKAGVRHLLVDFPSVDRMDDATLTNHRIFWARDSLKKTITELVYVPEKAADGIYLLNLQVAAFDGDAAPGRPVLYRMAT